jgi:NodT family efflux transporter outer membrane factor (OMF) lipoprotein
MKCDKLILFLVLIFILGSCQVKELTTQEINSQLPKNFRTNVSSDSTKLIKWRDLIFDKNLATLIDSALANNFDLQIALQKIEVSRASVQFNKGVRLPELGASASAGIRKFGEYTMDGVGNYDTQFSSNLNDKQRVPNPLPDYYVGIQASWEIDLWGKLKNKKKSAAARFIASQHEKDLVVTNLVAEISSAYFELLALENEIKILENNISIQEEALNIVTIQKQTGVANELAVELMRAQLLNSKGILLQVKQMLIESESKINFLCGVYPRNVLRDTTLKLENIINSINEGIPSSILQNRPDIRQAEMELIATNADLKSAKAAFYPSFNINAFLGLQSFNALLLLEAPASLAYNALGGLTAPLLNRRKLKADLMNAKAEQMQAYINYEKNVVNAFIEVYNALIKLENTKNMYSIKLEETEVLKQSIYTSSELYKAGRATYMEILIAQKNALLAQIELNELKKRQGIAIINLYRALGGGWE